ncbi:MAG: tRNA 2-thiouridine(34) synthase MnmA [Desulfurobacteriaceae bacterium]
MGKSVLLGFSGGVDSFTAALILKEQGFQVFPVFLKLLPDSDTLKPKRAAKLLGLPLTVVDLSEEFKKEVIDYFIDYYRRGLTPNPCAVCNREIKLKYLYRLSRELSIPYMATGHYAIVTDKNPYGRRLIKRGVDRKKEQSYFFSLVKQEFFEKLLLPLGTYRKEDVVEIARKSGFDYRGESQDICFIPGDYADFLEKFIEPEPGNFVLKDGRVVGRHKGIFRYTVGQRRGLGVSYGKPLYVVELRPERNEVLLGEREDVMKDKFFIWKTNWHVPFEKVRSARDLKVQVRYRSRPVEVKSIECFKNGIYCVKLAAEIEAPAPGQVCAVYSSDLLLGGGEITREGVGEWLGA